MNDAERFDAALVELRSLLSNLHGHEVHVVLIGGQVLALELLASGRSGEVEIQTPTGIAVSRGYTLEADLLFDVDRLSYADDLPYRLRDAGFNNPTRAYRWEKSVGDFTFRVDLFCSPNAADEPPCSMNPAAAGDFALNHNHPVSVTVSGGTLTIKVPDGPAFIDMKLAARPLRREKDNKSKDAFDIYSYVQARGAAVSRRELARPELADLRRDLRGLFSHTSAEGVRDVISYSNLGAEEEALLAQAVVDLFSDVLAEEEVD